MKIGIIWANPYNKNLGVGALAYSSLALLNDVAIEMGIKADFVFFGGSGMNSDQIKFGNNAIPFENIRGFDFYYWKSYLKRIIFPDKTGIGQLKELDFIFDIGEGDSFADIYGEKRFKRIINSKIFFNRLRKKQILLPQTIGPFKNAAFERAAFNEMKKMDFIISRDMQSYDYTARHLPAHKITEAIDVAFYLPFEKGDFKNKKINVGINVSGLLWNGGYTRDNQFAMKTDYRSLVLQVIEYFCSLPNVQVHLVPHVIPDNNIVEDDYLASENIRDQHFENVIIAPRFDSPIAAKNYISSLDFFSGARMHSCIAALSAGVAVLPMAYSRKFNGLFQDTLKYRHMADCVNESTEISFNKLKDAYLRRFELQAEINEIARIIIKPKLEALKQTFKEIIATH